MFYNTGIATYMWVLTNRKPAHRKGKVQLIDATGLVQAAAEKSSARKIASCRMTDIDRITQAFLDFQRERAVEDFRQRRPRVLESDRRAAVADLAGIDAERAYTPKEIKALRAKQGVDPDAPPVIRKIHKSGASDPLQGLFQATIKGRRCVVEYEPDADLRDTEQVPFTEEGGIDAFIRREVLPHASDAWIDEEATKIGYEISFNRYFYKPQPLRGLDEIRRDILGARK